MSHKILRVGVVGCGGISQMMHLPFLAERRDRFEIVALSDIHEPTLAAMGARYQVSRCFTDYRALLEQPIDAVLIVSSNSHARPVLDALQAGKHVFVEKPLVESLKELEPIEREATKRRTQTLMVGYHKRYDPGYRYAREQIRNLRDLRMIRVDVLHPVDAHARTHYAFEPPMDPARLELASQEATDGLETFVKSPAVAEQVANIIGPNAPLTHQVSTFLLFNSLIHDINALRGILGEPEAVEHAEFWRGGRCMNVLLRWNDQVRCALNWIYLPGLKNYKEELLFLSPERRVTIAFPSPYFRHFPTPITIESMEGGTYQETKAVVSLDEAFRAELHHFYDCVVEGRKPETDLLDAKQDTILLEQIARAYKH